MKLRTSIAAFLLALLVRDASLAYAQSESPNSDGGRWQWIDAGANPREIYASFHADADGYERADIGVLYEPNVVNGEPSEVRLMFTNHGIIRHVADRNVILFDFDSPAEFVIRPNGNLIVTWLPMDAYRQLQLPGHWPTDDEILAVIRANRGDFIRRLEMTPAQQTFPELNWRSRP